MANTNIGYKNQRRNGNGKPPYGRAKPFNLEPVLNDPCPKHSLPNRPSAHAWKDWFIMREFRNHNLNQHHDNGNGPPGESGSGSQGSKFGGVGSNNGYQGQGGYNQQSGQGNQQQNNQSGYQSNPKQLNRDQYHIFTTSLCKQD